MGCPVTGRYRTNSQKGSAVRLSSWSKNKLWTTKKEMRKEIGGTYSVWQEVTSAEWHARSYWCRRPYRPRRLGLHCLHHVHRGSNGNKSFLTMPFSRVHYMYTVICMLLYSCWPVLYRATRRYIFISSDATDRDKTIDQS